MAKKKKEREEFNRGFSTILIVCIWLIGLIPLFGILFLRYVRTDSETLPSISVLENQQELLATTVIAGDGITELGKFWKVNRTSVPYNEISPYVISALISTEDERFNIHSGIDTRALARAVSKMGKAGGASTITQQLAKLIFTLKERDERKDELMELANDTIVAVPTQQKRNKIENRIIEKVKENVIALRLEKRYTKQEIITMYLNQFDFLYNAVGIRSAARVYFDKTPAELGPDEAAILVGMCKNPGLYNPYTYTIRDYKSRIAKEKNISEEDVLEDEIKALREKDSLRTIHRRNVVLFKWYENSKKNNEALTSKITKAEYDSLKALPLHVSYQKVDFKEGIAPYFREYIRSQVSKMLREKLPDGSYKFHKLNGEPYNIYEDGLKIYTSLDVKIQQYAEEALTKHLSKNIQKPFNENNRRSPKFPFASNIKDNIIQGILDRTRRRSDRFYNMRLKGIPESTILASFDEPTPMKIFSWDGDIDTVMTPNDSILYYKNIMRAGLVSIEPQTGFIKAWVGGPDIRHFAYDHVAQGKRQVGSTIKPFIYSAGMQLGKITPCETTPNIPYCVDVPVGSGIEDMKQWCPGNSGTKLDGKPTSFNKGLSFSMNNITVAVMARMGGATGPQAVAKLMRALNINLRDEDVVPAMALGVMDLSLLEMAAAQSAFVNDGIYSVPSAIIRIEDRNGNTIYEHEPETREAMSEDLAYATLQMMKNVVTSGTGASLRGTWRDWGGITQPTAGKTGTTQNNSDGWFMALTPDLVTGVWAGAEDMAVRFRSMTWGQGARMALPIYGYMMQKVYEDPAIHLSQEDFKAPPGYENSIYNCTTGSDGGNTNKNDNPFGL